MNLLFVCTANRIRSPLAAAVVNGLDMSGNLHAESAGIWAAPGAPPVAEALAVARAMDIDLADYRSRDLSAVALTDFDLVIGFEFQHMAHVVVDRGAPPEETFLLPEAVRVLEDVRNAHDPAAPPIDPAALIAQAHARRAGGSFVASDEIADPIGRPLASYERTAELIRELCSRLVAALS